MDFITPMPKPHNPKGYEDEDKKKEAKKIDLPKQVVKETPDIRPFTSGIGTSIFEIIEPVLFVLWYGGLILFGCFVFAMIINGLGG